MASLHKDIPIDASADHAWTMVRDFGAVQKLAPGFVTESRLEGDTRIVTFANGNVAREMLVDCDEARRRLVYAISNERVTHYNAAVQIVEDGAAKCRLLWTIDLLPREIAPYIAGQMEQAARAMQQALSQA
jgi:hypothetical protein